ncbi:hypothetical protein Anapl_16516 [Anas platyrhynchos]|uniref:Uncharacterized protein n=1 Tax=Anas platyrhynchos TaxID=8839 RepID=R0M033_ANAPL|nr:hypothetical protein Anapl_16516 [Anas platyrhynchos]
METAATTDFYSWEYDPSWDDGMLPELCEKQEVQGFARTYQPAVYLLLLLLGTVGNGLVLLTHTRTTAGHTASPTSLLVSEEMRSLIVEKGPGPVEEDPDALVKGWLQREVRGGVKTPWIRPRKYWFVLTPDSLDYYSSNEKGAKRLGSLVLTSLCSATGA